MTITGRLTQWAQIRAQGETATVYRTPDGYAIEHRGETTHAATWRNALAYAAYTVRTEEGSSR